MKVLFDSLGFLEPMGGVSRYFAELARHFPDDVHWEIAAKETDNVYLQAVPFDIPPSGFSFRSFLPGKNFRGKRMLYDLLAGLGVLKSMELANSRFFRERLEGDGFDVLHLTAPHGCGLDYRKYRGKAKIVITIHDLIPDMMLDGVRGARIRRQRKYDLARCDAVIAVSEHTKRDLIRLYGVDERKIAVVHHGFAQDSFSHAASPENPGKYILYVGKRGGYKNSDFFLREAAPLLRSNPGLQIVMTGRGLDAHERAICEDCGIGGRVEAGFFSDAELRGLYENAACFVYPSKYEGFGLPVLEAFAAGCPVVLANATCFPEVGGDAALYFDPDNGDELRHCIANAIGGRRGELVKKGLSRVRRFAWEECARRTAEVYRKVLEGGL